MKKNTSYLKKTSIVVLVLAAVVLMGLAILEGMSDYLKDSTAVTDEALTSVVIGTAKSLAHDEIVTTQTVSVYNATNSSDTLTEDTHYTINYDAGTLNLLAAGSAWNNTNLNVSYYYLADTTESLVADLFKTGLTIFATFAAIIVLALVGKFVIGIFAA